MPVLLAGVSPALKYAGFVLSEQGICITHTPSWKTEDVLLDVPSVRPGGMSQEALDTLLMSLPREARLWGGNLQISDRPCIDLLNDEDYLWENAGITARCALNLTEPMLHRDWKDSHVLILGWGRIGTYLVKILSDRGACVAVAVRNPDHMYRLRALGQQSVTYGSIVSDQTDYHVVFNTVPVPVLKENPFSPDCIQIDLASRQTLPGKHVIHARGLPGIYAPEESGKLIAETYLRMRKEFLA